MRHIKVNRYENFSQTAAELMMNQVEKKPNSTLGLATGSTPKGMYQELVKRSADLSQAVTFNLDEYVGISSDHPQSYRSFMEENLFQHIRVGETLIPDGEAADLAAECERYEQLINQHGGIDLQVLGLGHNGHIGFNEPGTPFSSRTHVVDLAETTRKANARFFNSLNEVPKKAITMGIETIMEADQIILLVYGEDKQQAVNRLLQGDVNEQFPASILHEHPNVTLVSGGVKVLN
ncbi:glucosamine-6-phosphate deaminase [Alkalibacillus haloalkaliphilus]|uniref:Glucosamine-6-phosphate deaminase n=1 Tax=Alkalibacillus haloalkaliphilus TaxID=94136 RepID=A0A511W781_9BACI|nr:glucosamine-6-phosphate deaminase [Alkalibacillus haloalkaliphilus]GEN46601.1 glucosamine-6-phosphate deaminase 1 [Alkalibacillus haloalkaliphilus]